MKSTYSKWENKQMGLEPYIGGLSKLEIDKSKIVNYDRTIRWMLGIVDSA